MFQITDASGTILFRDDRTYDSWQHLCVSLKDLSGATIYILFGAVDENGNLVETDSKHDVAAALALDDVRVSEVPCPCSYSFDLSFFDSVLRSLMELLF